MRQQEADSRQLELPISREQKLEIAALLRIRDPPVISKTRQQNLAKFIEQIELNADEDGFCRRGQEVMAAKHGVDVRTYRRWRQDAVDLEFIKSRARECFGAGDNQADGVDWFAVARRVRVSVGSERALESPSDAERVHDSPSAKTQQNAAPDNCPVRPDIFQTALPLPSLNVSLDTNLHNHNHNHDGSSALTTQTADNCPVVPDTFSKTGFFRLSIEDLASADRIDEWFQWAVAVGRAKLCDRQRIFAAARSIVRRHLTAKRQGLIAPGVGAFISNVRHRRWFADQADDDWARRALQHIDREAT